MKPLHIATIILGILLLTLIVLFLWPEKTAQPPSVTELEKAKVAPLEAEPQIRYPLPEPSPPPPGEEKEQVEPLPPLAKSDPFMKRMLTRLFGASATQNLLIPQQFVRRTVLIIDALPSKKQPQQHLPLRPPAGSFQAGGDEENQVISGQNFARYTPYVRLAEAVPPKKLAQAYLHVYPLLEEAYRELGHKERYFHDRMIDVLDHLIATPEVKEPIPVKHHVTRYRFVDQRLEDLSAGQKILVRMGSENAARVKKVLRNLRDELIAEPKGSGEPTGKAGD